MSQDPNEQQTPPPPGSPYRGAPPLPPGVYQHPHHHHHHMMHPGMTPMGMSPMGTPGMMGTSPMGTPGMMGTSPMGTPGMMGTSPMGTPGMMGTSPMGTPGMMGTSPMGMSPLGMSPMGTSPAPTSPTPARPPARARGAAADTAMQGAPVMPPGMTMNADGWMILSQGMGSNDLIGLAYLEAVDKLLLVQKKSPLIDGTGAANKYEVFNVFHMKLFFCVEESGYKFRKWCGSRRPFEMTIVDNVANEVIRLNRGFGFTSCFCFCCRNKMEVHSPPRNVIGRIEQCWSMFGPRFKIVNADGEIVYRIQGPYHTAVQGGDVKTFKVTDNGEEVASIKKQRGGFVNDKGLNLNLDTFAISYSPDMDVVSKTLILSSSILIDYMYYE